MLLELGKDGTVYENTEQFEIQAADLHITEQECLNGIYFNRLK
jgi:hypothetical protein